MNRFLIMQQAELDQVEEAARRGDNETAIRGFHRMEENNTKYKRKLCEEIRDVMRILISDEYIRGPNRFETQTPSDKTEGEEK